ncbi:hypothetical protein [Paenarthrobacter ureafaciens]|uniref:hypothetical protein n=1 Tax=Paenarthrobacter ureafaciens TaxID=37931 RepID=UPI0015BF1030|nr:hypothetical protein [Paenarthrobacter ureafaciens]
MKTILIVLVCAASALSLIGGWRLLTSSEVRRELGLGLVGAGAVGAASLYLLAG